MGTLASVMIELNLVGVRLELPTNSPIVLLREREGERYLPIWIGAMEATAIAFALQGIVTARPMTHDLMKNILESVEAKVEKIVVNDLRDNTFFALIHIRLGEEEITVDSRPSDAIALALRVGAPIFVEEDVVRRAKNVEVAPKEADDQEKLKEWLENIKPEDFGKYKL